MTKPTDTDGNFQAAFRSRHAHGRSTARVEWLAFGCERRTASDAYSWDGMRRDWDPAHPRVVFQVTLSGWGAYSQRQPERTWKVGPESGFFTIIPSPHVYWLPPESPVWNFFWLDITHPWAVERMKALAQRHPPVFALGENSKLMMSSRSFFDNMACRRLPDVFAEEAALLEWMLEFERHLHELAHPREPREWMLGELQAFTLANLDRSFGIDEFARRLGKSRSHYSHEFKRVTGLAPAGYVLQVRLGEAMRLLRETAEPVKEIAAATGFADANHFCKVFRRHYHTSPGFYREWLRR